MPTPSALAVAMVAVAVSSLFALANAFPAKAFLTTTSPNPAFSARYGRHYKYSYIDGSERRCASRTWMSIPSIEENASTDGFTVAAEEKDGGVKKGMTLLTFAAKSTSSSETAPLTPAGESFPSLMDFFALDESRAILLSGSENNVVELTSESIDRELMEAYEKECERGAAGTPTELDRIFEVTTEGVEFPGLRVTVVATVGTHLGFVEVDGGGVFYPRYEFVLIKDTTKAEGSRPLVWLFNKIAGPADKKSEKSTQMTHSVSSISAIPVGEKDVRFEFRSTLEVQMKFPSIIMKFIPEGKKKAEENGGASVLKSLEKDIPVSIEKFREAYVRWLES